MLLFLPIVIFSLISFVYWLISLKNAKKSYIENVQKRAIKYAESRWKRESKRNEYVASEIEKANNDNYFDTEIYHISFTIKPNKARLETPAVCCLHKKTDENQLRECFQKIKDDKYFRHGSGWAFRYETNSKKFPKYSFIPSVDIILDEEFSKLQKAEEKSLERAIDNFYKDIKYKGD